MSKAEIPSAFPVSERLRPHLASLMGKSGFRALLARALALAGEEVPWLRAVQVNANGALEGLEEFHEQLDPAKFLEGKIVLEAQLLGLLVAFIGESLTLQLVRESWPKVSLNGLVFDNGGQHEKTK